MKYRIVRNSVTVGVLLACATITATMVQAKDPPVPAILASPMPDYSFAGYGFGIAAIPTDTGTVIDAADFGVVPDDGMDDAKALLKALEAASKIQGRVTVRLPKGRIQIGEIIPLARGLLTLAGSGSEDGGTELYFPRPLSIVDDPARDMELHDYLLREDKYQVEPDQNINFLFSEYSWGRGFLAVGPKGTRPVSYDGTKDKRDPVLTRALAGKQFGQTLTVADASKLKVGQVVQLQWFSDDGPDSPILHSIYGDFASWNDVQTDESRKLNVGSHHWTFPNRPVVVQPTRIVAIKDNRITLGDQLLHDVSPSQRAVIADWEHLEEVGIQDMRLTFPENPWFGHHLEAGYNGIYMTGVFDGWINNLVISNADSGILTDNAGSLTISNIVTKGEHRAHYAVHVGSVHNVLVSDLLVENPVIHPVSINTRSTHSVFRRATVMREAAIDQHSGSNHQNLFDQLTLHIGPQDADGVYRYRLWNGGGAPYWKPGHGLYNTQWNIKLVMPETVPQDAVVTISSGLEGPGARIIGMHANRAIAIAYTPTPIEQGTNQSLTTVPSLYDYQLTRRLKAAGKR